MTQKNLVLGVLSVFITGLILVFAPIGIVRAESVDSNSVFSNMTLMDDEINHPDQSGGQIRNAYLERLFLRESQNHALQKLTLSQMESLVSQFDKIITRAKGNEKDVTDLEAALDVFTKKIGEAQLKFDQNETLIGEHYGFDSEGKVLVTDSARNTVESVRQGNQEVRQILGEGLKVFRAAIMVFREANPGMLEKTAVNPM